MDRLPWRVDRRLDDRSNHAVEPGPAGRLRHGLGCPGRKRRDDRRASQQRNDRQGSKAGSQGHGDTPRAGWGSKGQRYGGDRLTAAPSPDRNKPTLATAGIPASFTVQEARKPGFPPPGRAATGPRGFRNRGRPELRERNDPDGLVTLYQCPILDARARSENAAGGGLEDPRPAAREPTALPPPTGIALSPSPSCLARSGWESAGSRPRSRRSR